LADRQLCWLQAARGDRTEDRSHDLVKLIRPIETKESIAEGQWLKVTRRLAAEVRTFWQLKETIFYWRGTNEMQKQQGFSLIELLIVVAIILIIAAIAIPNLLRARIAANESSAVSSIRTINTAEVSYQTRTPQSVMQRSCPTSDRALAFTCARPS
jgi:prepilin-type N-terminal cleavage/methylation domain-containing protein